MTVHEVWVIPSYIRIVIFWWLHMYITTDCHIATHNSLSLHHWQIVHEAVHEAHEAVHEAHEQLMRLMNSVSMLYYYYQIMKIVHEPNHRYLLVRNSMTTLTQCIHIQHAQFIEFPKIHYIRPHSSSSVARVVYHCQLSTRQTIRRHGPIKSRVYYVHKAKLCIVSVLNLYMN